MNFEMAAELCQMEGIQVEAVVIDDDVAVQDSLYTAGRRGVGATVLAEKICGAAAEQGYDSGRVAGLCRRVERQRRARMGMALTSCTVPAAGKPTFELGRRRDGDGHRHPRRAGTRARCPWPRRTRSSQRMAAAIIGDLPFRRGDKVIAMVNGMGGTPLIELYLVYNELAAVPAGPGHHDRPSAWSATTSHRWRWPAARSRCCALDDEMIGAVGRAGAYTRRCAGGYEPWVTRDSDVWPGCEALQGSFAEQPPVSHRA